MQPCVPEVHTLLKRLGVIGAPTVVLQIVTLVLWNLGGVDMNLDAVEYFAGEMAVPTLKKRECKRAMTKKSNGTKSNGTKAPPA